MGCSQTRPRCQAGPTRGRPAGDGRLHRNEHRTMANPGMITLDGSQGEGGGQILRSSLALSIITGRPFRLFNIRAGRAKPGLMRQHLASVHAAVAISRAEVVGDDLGSTELTFKPSELAPGNHHFKIGSAGSTLLVLQTVLPPLMRASAPSELLIEGGTHNPFAPPFPFIERSFLPLLARIGFKVEARLERPGFYPAGGGRIRVRIEPHAELRRLELGPRAAMPVLKAEALVAGLPSRIAHRELTALAADLAIPLSESNPVELSGSHGPGNVLLVDATTSDATALFTGFGRTDVRAESVAAEVAEQVRRFLACPASVDEHLADQLLLPLALARGGTFTTMPPTDHTRTNAAILAQFLGREIRLEPRPDGTTCIHVPAND